MGSLLGAGGLLDGGLIRGWGLNKLSRWTKVLSGWSCSTEMLHTASPGKGGGFLGSMFAGYVPLVSQNPYPIIVYSAAIYRPHLSHFWPRIFPLLNACLPEFS